MEGRRISGRRADAFPPRRRTRWDFGRVADGQVYLLRKGRDFDVEVASLAIAARRWAREHGCRLTTRSEFDERQEAPRWACTFGSSRQVAANGGGEPTVRRNVVDLSLQRRLPGRLLRVQGRRLGGPATTDALVGCRAQVLAWTHAWTAGSTAVAASSIC
jgi:hypothetical protein